MPSSCLTAPIWRGLHMVSTLHLQDLFIATNDLRVIFSFRKNEHRSPLDYFIFSSSFLLSNLRASFIFISHTKIKSIDNFLSKFFCASSYNNIWYSSISDNSYVLLPLQIQLVLIKICAFKKNENVFWSWSQAQSLIITLPKTANLATTPKFMF